MRILLTIQNGSAVYGIESANIVGYAPAELPENGMTVGACFVPVANKTFDLTDLTVTGYDKEEGSEGQLYIQTLDEAGRTVASYFWIDVVDGEDILFGWLDEDDNPVEKGAVTFQAGEGLWVFANDEGLAIQSAGQVPQKDVAVTLAENGLSLANPTPVDVDLTDCYLTGYDKEEGSEGQFYIQTLDEAGRTIASYFWIDVVDGEDVLFGWLDEDDNPIEVEDVVLKPGLGIWSFSNAEGLMFNFPGVAL